MSENAKRRARPGVLVCIAIGLAAACALAQTPDDRAENGPAQILELTDSLLIARAWQTFFPDSAAPEGDYQVLFPSAATPGPMSGSATPGPGSAPSAGAQSAYTYLLRNGTQVGRMDRAAWDVLAATAAKGNSWVTAAEGPEAQDVPLLWRAFKWEPETLLGWAEWPAGFTMGVGSEIASIKSAKPQYQREFAFAWDQKLFGHYLIGAQAHRTQFGGGLTRLGQEVADTLNGDPAAPDSLSFWGQGYWWWALSLGVPGLKYTASLASRPLPDYYWMETDAAALIRARKAGNVVKQWAGGPMAKPGNLAHTLDARLGVLRYQVHWDLDAYAAPVQTFAFEDLPALFGTWGAGVMVASNIVATRIWLDIPDMQLPLFIPEAYPSKFHFAFLHLDFAYRNLRSFDLGFSVRVRIENPIMNRPGA